MKHGQTKRKTLSFRYTVNVKRISVSLLRYFIVVGALKRSKSISRTENNQLVKNKSARRLSVKGKVRKLLLFLIVN